MTLDQMDYKELLATKTKIEEELSAMRATALVDAGRAIQTIISESGFTEKEVFAAMKGSVRGSEKEVGQPKYRNPSDKSKTWSGKGHRPGWVKDRLDAGNSLESLAIK